MPKGLKSTSSIIQIGAQVQESAPNTFTQQAVDLQLNPLDNEVFVVIAANLDLGAPDLVAGANTTTNFSVSSTARDSIGSISDSNVIAHKRTQIQDNGVTAVLDEHMSGETPASTLDYVFIIATNDFFLNLRGDNNASAKTGIVRLYGYRARADSATYAALVQSEVLSS